MKKLSLFLLGCFATSLMSFAQDITPDMFVLTKNTGANMTVGINSSVFDQFAGGQIGAFYDLNANGTFDLPYIYGGSEITECVGLYQVTEGFMGLALWGDDSSTSDKDGLASGDSPEFAILHDGNVIEVGELPQFPGYVTNGITNVTGATLYGGAGCTDESACNTMFMYPGVDYDDDGSCDFQSCIGCMDSTACNYDLNATVDDGSCEYADDVCEVCENGTVAVYDADGDGYCDLGSGLSPQEIPGCTDNNPNTNGGIACNFDPDATEEDFSCEYLSCAGCTNPSACNYDSTATLSAVCNVPDGPCDTCDDNGEVVDNDDDGDGYCNLGSGIAPEEVVGCMNPSAPNYDPSATDPAEEGSELACEEAEICFTTDPMYPCELITSNNMSVLFPVNNAGLWNSDQSNVQEGDLVAAFYTTSTLDNDFLGYSAIASIANAGGVSWSGGQVGVAVFGADNGLDNGFEPGEELLWLVMRDGVAHTASVTYATPGYDGTYQENAYVSANSLVVGAPFSSGCTNSNYMEYNPLATTDTDPSSCSTFISVGCLDANFVNYAGADVDSAAIHDNSNNFGAPFSENYTIDLNSGATSPSGVAANFHDVSLCQSQVLGCTYPYASNYDAAVTEDDGSCDWSAYSYHTFDPITGENTGTIYSFGGDDDDSNNEWVESDFEYANDLYQDARMGTGHIVTDLIASYDAYTLRRKADSTFLSDTLLDVADWFAADEAADLQELTDSLDDNYDRFDRMFNYLSDSIQLTLDSAALAFAADEAADAEELADTINDMQSRYDAMFASLNDSISFTLDSAQTAHDEYADARDEELQDTIDAKDARYDDLMILVSGSADGSLAHDLTDSHYTRDLDEDHGIIGNLQDALNYHASPLVINLHSGWNTVAYYVHHESSVVAQFENQFGSEAAVQDNVNIVKNNEGLFYWPDFLFDGLGNLEPGQGYQVRVKDASTGKSDFVFDDSIAPGDNRILNPTVPAWALEMEVENHPNDIRTLVRVVNMLGQEVVPAEQFAGEVLLYLYNDGTVEKKMVE